MALFRCPLQVRHIRIWLFVCSKNRFCGSFCLWGFLFRRKKKCLLPRKIYFKPFESRNPDLRCEDQKGLHKLFVRDWLRMCIPSSLFLLCCTILNMCELAQPSTLLASLVMICRWIETWLKFRDLCEWQLLSCHCSSLGKPQSWWRALCFVVLPLCWQEAVVDLSTVFLAFCLHVSGECWKVQFLLEWMMAAKAFLCRVCETSRTASAD